MAKLPIPFSNPRTYAGHSGVDFGQPRGTAFRASGLGTVVTRGHNARGGYYVWVKYDVGPKVGYHHMDSHRGVPAVGARVSEGSVLGYVGNTGNSTGPHLHSEVAGHATTAGYWRFFDPGRVVGQRPDTSGINPIPTQEDSMFIAIVRKTDWYLVTGGKAFLLGAASGARESGAPILNFVDDWAVNQLKSVVSGIK